MCITIILLNTTVHYEYTTHTRADAATTVAAAAAEVEAAAEAEKASILNDNGEVLSITVHRADKLEPDIFIVHPVVRVYLVDADTGKLVDKHDPLVTPTPPIAESLALSASRSPTYLNYICEHKILSYYLDFMVIL